LAPVDLANKSGMETGEDKGLAVLNVTEDSAADLSGISGGDVISLIDDKEVNNKEDFLNAVKGKNKILLKTNSGFFVLKIK
jgi:S1-C subfamily serine protease